MVTVHMAEPVDPAAANAKRLLTWATFLAMVSLAVLGLDVMIKNQILTAAKDVDRRLGEVNREARREPGEIHRIRPGAPGSNHQAPAGNGAASRFAMGDDPGSPAEGNGDAGSAEVPESSPAAGDGSGS